MNGSDQMNGSDPVQGSDQLVELEVGPIAHGGHCVARHEGRVVFVRHALPGERVRVRLTDAAPEATFWRGDAVEVLSASPDRVESACPVSGPGGCGGCDFQHVSLAGQRELKAAVVTEQLQRLGKLSPSELPGGAVVVEPMGSSAEQGFGWRTRLRFTVNGRGQLGFRRHRSHDVVPVTGCPIAHPGLRVGELIDFTYKGAEAVDAVVSGTGDRLLVVETKPGAGAPTAPTADGLSVASRDGATLRRMRGRTWVSEPVRVEGEPRAFRVTGAGFWQVHPDSAQTLLDAVLEMADPQPAERVLDLYSGAGLFTAGLAVRVGITGTVIAVESEARAVADARRSLHDLPQVEAQVGRVEKILPQVYADLVVMDPPRAGAGRAVIEQLAAMKPRAIVYVACDPAALARDVATAAGLGYRLDALRAFDAFPMTHHVECVARLVPAT